MAQDPFANLREVLMLGYLRLPVTIGALNIVLGTPSLNDLSYSLELDGLLERGAFLISRSIKTLRGREVQEDEVIYEKLDKMMSYLNMSKFLRLYYYSLRLIKKEEDTFKVLEPFLYTKESRDLWNKVKARRYHGETVFKAPLNHFQVYWTSWNIEEDARLERKESWDQTMLMASAFNPKGVKSIRDKWYKQDEELDKERQNVLSDFLAGNGVNFKETKKETEAERLHREFAMWVSGEQDEHDKIVESYKKEMMDNIDRMQKRQEELRQQNRQRALDEEGLKMNKLVGLTDQDLAKINVTKTSNTITIHNEVQSGLKNVLDKYLYSKEDAGTLTVVDGKLMPKDVSKPSSTSLMEDVLSRPKPTMED